MFFLYSCCKNELLFFLGGVESFQDCIPEGLEGCPRCMSDHEVVLQYKRSMEEKGVNHDSFFKEVRALLP